MENLINVKWNKIEPFQGSNILALRFLRFHRRLFKFKSFGLKMQKKS